MLAHRLLVCSFLSFVSAQEGNPAQYPGTGTPVTSEVEITTTDAGKTVVYDATPAFQPSLGQCVNLPFQTQANIAAGDPAHKIVVKGPFVKVTAHLLSLCGCSDAAGKNDCKGSSHTITVGKCDKSLAEPDVLDTALIPNFRYYQSYRVEPCTPAAAPGSGEANAEICKPCLVEFGEAGGCMDQGAVSKTIASGGYWERHCHMCSVNVASYCEKLLEKEENPFTNPKPGEFSSSKPAFDPKKRDSNRPGAGPSGEWVISQPGVACSIACAGIGGTCTDLSKQKQAEMTCGDGSDTDMMKIFPAYCHMCDSPRGYAGTPFNVNTACRPLDHGSPAVCDTQSNLSHKALCYCEL